jgi:hypothetical protein
MSLVRRVLTCSARSVLMFPVLCWAQSYGNSGNVTITSVQVYVPPQGTGAIVQFSPAAASPNGFPGCASQNGNSVWIDFSATGSPNGRDLYATVLAASAGGKLVVLGTYGCAANGLPLVYSIIYYP